MIDDEFTETKSSGTCYLDEIQGFIYGASHSLFWMFRQHINTINKQKISNITFFSWNCITIQLN